MAKAAELPVQTAVQADPHEPRAAGSRYWRRVATLLRDSYRSLDAALVAAPAPAAAGPTAEPGIA